MCCIKEVKQRVSGVENVLYWRSKERVSGVENVLYWKGYAPRVWRGKCAELERLSSACLAWKMCCIERLSTACLAWKMC